MFDNQSVVATFFFIKLRVFDNFDTSWKNFGHRISQYIDQQDVCALDYQIAVLLIFLKGFDHFASLLATKTSCWLVEENDSRVVTR